MARAMNEQKAGLGELEQGAIVDGTSQAVMTIIVVMAALVGVWGLACLIGGLAESSVIEMIGGWWIAVVGG